MSMNLQDTPFLTLLVYIGLFVGILLAFEGLRAVLSRSEDVSQARNRRLRMIQKGSSREELLALFTQRKKPGPLTGIGQLLRQSGASFGIRTYAAIVTATGLLTFAIASRFLEPMLAAGPAVLVGLLLPYLGLKAARQTRMEKLTKQLPDALDLMARGLKVGHPLNVTVGSVAREMPDPIGTEFGLIQDQVSYGETIVDAFADMADRLGTEDVRYLAVSVGIQHGTGGNLGHILRVLAKVIRGRATMRKKIKAISAEGRISATILSILPFGIFGLINLTSPGFYRDVADDPIFMPVMITILALVILQALILNRMVKFKF